MDGPFDPAAMAGYRASMRVAVLLGFLLASSPAAQQPPTAASVTEPGRTLTRPLDIVLGGPSTAAQERTVIVVVDPAAGLVKAGFATAFATAVQQNQKQLANTKLGLGVVGQKGVLVVPPTTDHGTVLAQLRSSLDRPAAEFQNVYADLRTAAAAFPSGSGDRVLLLATLENGDVEDDVEQTVTLLRKARIQVEVFTSEATFRPRTTTGRRGHAAPHG
jgi:hypothetical protein